jgi:hypothetical protein
MEIYAPFGFARLNLTAEIAENAEIGGISVIVLISKFREMHLQRPNAVDWNLFFIPLILKNATSLPRMSH